MTDMASAHTLIIFIVRSSHGVENLGIAGVGRLSRESENLRRQNPI
jgi:hypothetical protein